MSEQLPPEILSMIASHADDRVLHSLRSTSRANYESLGSEVQKRRERSVRRGRPVRIPMSLAGKGPEDPEDFVITFDDVKKHAEIHDDPQELIDYIYNELPAEVATRGNDPDFIEEIGESWHGGHIGRTWTKPDAYVREFPRVILALQRTLGLTDETCITWLQDILDAHGVDPRDTEIGARFFQNPFVELLQTDELKKISDSLSNVAR